MKNVNIIYPFLFLTLSLVSGCTAGKRHERLLAEADSLNQSGVVFSSDSIPRLLVDYYDRHGSANERMKAYYLLGRAYSDMGEAPLALQCFHDAAECADTAARDCDFRTLNRVYGQMGELFYDQYMPRNLLEAYGKAVSYAYRDKDTLFALIFYQRTADAYDLLKKKDSVIYICEEAFRRFTERGYRDLAARSLPMAIYELVGLKKLEKAKGYMNVYESESGYFDSKGNIQKGL